MTELEPNDDQRIQRHVLKHIGKKNAREMAAELGVSPEEILRAKREIVESVDDLTIQIQKMKLLAKLQDLADEAHDRSQRVEDDRNYAGIVNAAAGAIDKLLKELNRSAAQDSAAVDALNAMRVREIVGIYREVIDATVPLIAERHGIDEDALFGMFNDALKRATERRDIA